MSKKSFKDINPALAFITTPEEQEAQEAPSTQEVQEAQQPPTTPKHPTQGKRGKRLPRINMAFSPENLEYLQLIARIEGLSITRYVNQLVEKDQEKRAQEVERAKTVLKGDL